MKYFLLVAILMLPRHGFSQRAPVEFGDIPMEDMKMTSYDRDSSASAVVLVDYGEAHIEEVNGSIRLSYQRHVRSKILKKAGFSLANVKLSLYHVGSTEERVGKLKGSTYNLEGGKIVETAMAKESVFKEKFNQNVNHQKFTLPAVKVGSVIEYSYTITSEFYTSFPNWKFQKDIPVRWSEYWAIIPSFFIYEKYMQGYVPPTVYEVKHAATSALEVDGYHWISKDVPAFKKEPFMTCEEDYVSKINFELATIRIPGEMVKNIMGSWEKLNTVLLEDEDFGKVISKSGFLKNKVEELTAGMTDPMQKVTTIHSYVKQNIEWDGTQDYTAGNLKKITELKKGTSGDINLLLASMLDKAGFDVDMVLLSTRDHGFIRREFPVSRQFNYAICLLKLGDKKLLLDATEKYLPLTILPERCLNGEGLVISVKNYGWIDLSSATRSRTVTTADLKLDEKGGLAGTLTFIRAGYDAFDMRKEFNSKGEKVYVKEFLGNRNWQIAKTEFGELQELDKPVKEMHDVVINEHATVSGDIIYINPYVDSQEVENPFKTEKRDYPVDFGSPNEKIYLCKITMPEGFSVDELPSSKVLTMPGNAGRFSYNAILIGNTISISSNLQINRSLFLQTEYPILREFYNQIVAKQAEQVVLKRKKP